jgi:PAS domain S-box-containing protein
MVLNHLQAYAQFLLANHLDELVRVNLERAREIHLPLLKHFSHLTEAELFAYSKNSFQSLLRDLAEGRAVESHQANLQRWKSDQIPGISTANINTLDLTLSPHTRKYSLIRLLKHYTQDIHRYEAVVQEIEWYYSSTVGEFLESFVALQSEALQKERDFLHTVLNNTVDGISAYAPDLRITLWNQALESRTQLKRETMIGSKLTDVLPDYRNTPDLAAMHQALQGEKVQLRDMPYKNRSGYYESDLIPLRDLQGQVNGLLAVSRDITERKLAAEKIERSERLMSIAQAMAHVGSWEWDLLTDEIFWSDELYRIYGYDPQSMKVTMEWAFSHFHPDDLPALETAIQEALTETGTLENIHRIFRQDNSVRIIHLKGRVIRNPDGKPLTFFGSSQDITEQREAEQQLHAKNQELATALEELRSAQESLMDVNNELEKRVLERTQELTASREELRQTLARTVALNAQLQERENFLSSIIDQTPVSTWIADPDGTMIRVNQACLKLFGVPDASLGLGKYNILKDNTIQDTPFYKDIQAVFREGIIARYEVDYNVSQVSHVSIPGGRPVSLVVTVFPIKNAQGQVTNVVVQHEDITERKKAEKALLYQHKLTRTITDNATSGLLLMDAQGYCTFVNPAGEKMLGYTFDELRRQPLHELVHHHRPDGAVYPVDECPIAQVLPLNRKLRAHEDYFIRKDGSFLPVSCSVSPIHEDGTPQATVVEVQDISEQRKAQKDLEEALLETRRNNVELERINSDLDNFIYVASHDLRAPIANLESITNMLQKRLSKNLSEVDNTLVQYAGESIRRLKQTISDLTQISRVQRDIDEERETIYFEDILRDIELDMNELLASGAIIETDIQTPSVHYARKNLRSILFNLISNGIKYRSPDRRAQVCIRTYTEGERVVLSVEDNGLGIAPGQVPKLFTMFKRFHTHVEGSGIGLYIIKRIIENHGGSIRVDSVEGEGTTFTVYF